MSEKFGRRGLFPNTAHLITPSVLLDGECPPEYQDTVLRYGVAIGCFYVLTSAIVLYFDSELGRVLLFSLVPAKTAIGIVCVLFLIGRLAGKVQRKYEIEPLNVVKELDRMTRVRNLIALTAYLLMVLVAGALIPIAVVIIFLQMFFRN